MKWLFLISLTFSAFAHSASSAPELLELASAQYEKKDWDSFFGVATYLKTLFPQSKEAARVQVLEVLGLMKQCQWHQAAEANEHVSFPSDKAELASMIDLVLTSLEGKAWKNHLPESSRHARGWNISADELRALAPNRVKRHVKTLCEKEEG